MEEEKIEYFTDEMHKSIYVFPPSYDYDYEKVEETRVARSMVPLTPTKMHVAKTDIRRNYYGK